MPNKQASKSSRINSAVAPDAKQSLIAIADKHYGGNQTAALNSLLLHAGLTQLDEPMEFMTTYNGVRCTAYAKPEVILGGDGWANIRTAEGLVHRFQQGGQWHDQEVSEVLDEGRF